MVIGKINTCQRTLLIVAGSLLALLVLIAVAGPSGGHHLQSSANDIAKDAVTLVDFEADSTNLALTKDIFGFGVVSEDDEGCLIGSCITYTKENPCGTLLHDGSDRYIGSFCAFALMGSCTCPC